MFIRHFLIWYFHYNELPTTLVRMLGWNIQLASNIRTSCISINKVLCWKCCTHTEHSCGCRMKSQKRRHEKFYQFKFFLVTMLLKQETFDIFRSKTNPGLEKEKKISTRQSKKRKQHRIFRSNMVSCKQNSCLTNTPHRVVEHFASRFDCHPDHTLCQFAAKFSGYSVFCGVLPFYSIEISFIAAHNTADAHGKLANSKFVLHVPCLAR